MAGRVMRPAEKHGIHSNEKAPVTGAFLVALPAFMPTCYAVILTVMLKVVSDG